MKRKRKYFELIERVFLDGKAIELVYDGNIYTMYIDNKVYLTILDSNLKAAKDIFYNKITLL